MKTPDNELEDDGLKGRFQKLFEDDEESLSQSQSRMLWYKISNDLPTAAPDGLGQFAKLMAADEVLPMAATWDRIAAAIGYSIWVQPRTWYWAAASLAGLSATLILVLNFTTEQKKQTSFVAPTEIKSTNDVGQVNAPITKNNQDGLKSVIAEESQSVYQRNAIEKGNTSIKEQNNPSPTHVEIDNQTEVKNYEATRKSKTEQSIGQTAIAAGNARKSSASKLAKKAPFSSKNKKSIVLPQVLNDIKSYADDGASNQSNIALITKEELAKLIANQMVPLDSAVGEESTGAESTSVITTASPSSLIAKSDSLQAPKKDSVIEANVLPSPIRQPIAAPRRMIWPDRWLAGVSFDYITRATSFNNTDDIYLIYKNNRQIATRNTQSIHLGGIYSLGKGWEVLVIGEYLEVKSVNQFKGDIGEVIENNVSQAGSTVRVVPILRNYETTIAKTSRYASFRVEPGYFFGKGRSGLTLRGFASVSHLLSNQLKATGEQMPGMIAPPAPNPLWTAGLSLGYRYPISAKLSVEFDAHYRQFIGNKQVTSTFSEQLRSFGLGFKVIY